MKNELRKRETGKSISFTRHGQTYENLIENRAGKAIGTKYEQIYQRDFRDKFGKDDSGKLYSLNKRANRKAEQLGKHLKKQYKLIDNRDILFVSSELRRAQDTIKIAAREMGIRLDSYNFKTNAGLNEREVLEYRVQEGYIPTDLIARLKDPTLGNLSRSDMEKLGDVVATKDFARIQEEFKLLGDNPYIHQRSLSYVGGNLLSTVNDIVSDNSNKHIILTGHCHSTGALIQEALKMPLLKNHFDVNCWSYDMKTKKPGEFILQNSFVPKE